MMRSYTEKQERSDQTESHREVLSVLPGGSLAGLSCGCNCTA